MWLRWLSVPMLLGSGVVLGLTLAATPGETSPEVRFARDMSAHHTQAVDMSVTLFRRASDPKVRLLAQDMLLTQQAQIGQMGGWLMAWGRTPGGREAPMAGMNRADMGLTSSAEVGTLGSLPAGLAETRYLALMRRHHLGGVAMARAALNTVKRPEVRAFAERVITAQTSEITAIDAMLRVRMAPNAPARPEMGDMLHD